MQPLRDKGSVNWFGSDPHNSSIDVDCLLSVDVNDTKQDDNRASYNYIVPSRGPVHLPHQLSGFHTLSRPRKGGSMQPSKLEVLVLTLDYCQGYSFWTLQGGNRW
jgi:hypothetical protein